MSGWQAIYLNTGDEATAIALAGSLGSDFAPGTTDGGNENFAFHVYTQWDRAPGTNGEDDAGQAAAGFWVLASFNTDLEAGLAAYDAVIATPYVREPAVPSNVWAGDSP